MNPAKISTGTVYVESVKDTTHQDKGIITLDSVLLHIAKGTSMTKVDIPWCSIVCAAVTVHQFFCIFSFLSHLFPLQ